MVHIGLTLGSMCLIVVVLENLNSALQESFSSNGKVRSFLPPEQIPVRAVSSHVFLKLHLYITFRVAGAVTGD